MAKKFALIIGIESYPEVSGQEKADYAQNDARVMAEYARQAGFHLIGGKALLDDEATNIKIIDRLELMFKYASPEDFILIYFAGHGDVNEYGGHLIPYDFKQEYTVNESTCISFDSIDRRLTRKKTKQFILFLDACHSGFAGKEVNLRSSISRNIRVYQEAEKKIETQVEEMLRRGDGSENVGRLVFTSCKPNEKSYPIDEFMHGLFTYYLLLGLKTKRQAVGAVNVEELVRFVKDNVFKYSLGKDRVQTPTAFTNIQGEFLVPAYYVPQRKGEVVSVPDLSGKMKEAQKELEVGNFDLAEQIINKILEEDNLNFDANRLLEELESKRSLARIKEDTEKRKNYEEWLRRGEGFMKSGILDKANECFENAARIFPGSEIVRSHLEDISTRKQIVKEDDILVSKGDKRTILKNLFEAAGKTVKENTFAEAMNLYNKILKTYPGNKRAVKEKTELFEMWLLNYKEDKRYFEMLGMLEDIILPDKSLKNSIPRFDEIYEECVFLYTQEFLKSRSSIEIDGLSEDLKNKEKLLRRYKKLLDEYRELAMEKEYNELLKIIEKMKDERTLLREQIKIKSALLEKADIFKADRNTFVKIDHVTTILKPLIENGLADRYIQEAYNRIKRKNIRHKIDTIQEMKESSITQLKTKEKKYRSFQKEYPDFYTNEVSTELERLNSLIEIHSVLAKEVETRKELSRQLRLLEGFDRKKLGPLARVIAAKITSLKAKIDVLKRKNKEKRYSSWDLLTMIFYTVINSVFSLYMAVHYFAVGGFFTGFGVVLFITLTVIALIFSWFGYGMKVEFQQMDEKYVMLREIAKITMTSSFSLAAYFNWRASPEAFFCLTSLVFLVAIIFIGLAFLGSIVLFEDYREEPPTDK